MSAGAGAHTRSHIPDIPSVNRNSCFSIHAHTRICRFLVHFTHFKRKKNSKNGDKTCKIAVLCNGEEKIAFSLNILSFNDLRFYIHSKCCEMLRVKKSSNSSLSIYHSTNYKLLLLLIEVLEKSFYNNKK
jgi:hypothetical protein